MNRFAKLIALTIGLILSVALTSVFVRDYMRYVTHWEATYDNVRAFGDQCEGQVISLKEDEPLSEARKSSPVLASPVRLGLRRTADWVYPKVGEAQIISCTFEAPGPFGWLDLGRLVGESEVYINSDLKWRETSNGPVRLTYGPASSLRVDIVSRGHGKPVGPATLIPPVVTNAKAELELIDRLYNFSTRDLRQYTVAGSLGIGIFLLAVICSAGLYADVVLFFLSTMLFAFVAMSQLQSWFTPIDILRLQYLQTIIQGLAIALFFRRTVARRDIVIMAAILLGTIALQEWNVLKFSKYIPLQFWLGGIPVIWGAVYIYQDVQHRKRLAGFYSGVVLILNAALLWSGLYVRESGVDLTTMIQFALVSAFSFILAYDLLRRARRALLKQFDWQAGSRHVLFANESYGKILSKLRLPQIDLQKIDEPSWSIEIHHDSRITLSASGDAHWLQKSGDQWQLVELGGLGVRDLGPKANQELCLVRYFKNSETIEVRSGEDLSRSIFSSVNKKIKQSPLPWTHGLCVIERVVNTRDL